MISIFDLFSIGIGPSSSHTIGPMKAAKIFIEKLSKKQFSNTTYLVIEVFGSLAFTGEGHGTDKAILMGMEGEDPRTIDPDSVDDRIAHIIESKTLNLNNTKKIKFNKELHFIFNKADQLPLHTNAMRFKAFSSDSNLILEEVYYSVGGGFIIQDDEDLDADNVTTPPYPFTTTKDLINLCKKNKLSIAQVMLANECSLANEAEVKQKIHQIFNVMKASIEKGCNTPGILPGGLNVKRRAHDLFIMLNKKGKPKTFEHIDSMNWLNMYAIAVNEENAAGGRVVTAPTNGAAGIIPAILNHYMTFYPQACADDIIEFLLTAGAIAILFKKNASISGSEVGCQGEVGVAASMAAAGLTAVLGGTLSQIENAAEIAIEHHLGMTCDPIGGLVQIPCIERNAMGSVKAVNAMNLAMTGSDSQMITLDQAILTMKKTGEDMMSIYKETSLGGLAASYIEC
jgi:L-serine dehydratase